MEKSANSSRPSSVFITATSQKGAKARYQAQQLAEAPAKCREVWASLATASAKHNGLLHRYNLKELVQAQSANLKDLLGVRSASELIELLDEDEDGALNQDEQMLLFAVIKERMQSLLPELGADGSLHRQLVASIRELESDILKYQKLLRERANNADTQLLVQHGQSRLASFNARWDAAFEELHSTRQVAIDNLKTKHFYELQTVASPRLSSRRATTMQEFQRRQIQYVLTEQYGAAATTVAAANHFNVQDLASERIRTANTMQCTKQKLRAQQQKELNFVEMKFQAKLRELIVEKEKQQTQLEKGLSAQLGELKKQQAHSARVSHKVAAHRDEVRRRIQVRRSLNKCKSHAIYQPAPSRNAATSAVSSALGMKKNHELYACVQSATRLQVQPEYTSARLRQALGVTAPPAALSALYDNDLVEVTG